MKGRVVLLDERNGRRIAALLQDGRLEDLLIAPREGDHIPLPGAIYAVRIDRTVPNQNAAFAQLGGQTGYLRDARELKPGNTTLAQVLAYAESGKAAPLTRRLMLKSRYALLTPGAPGINVARSVRDTDEKARLRAIAEDALEEAGLTANAETGPEVGIVLRSAAEGAEADEVMDDIIDLAAALSNFNADAPGLLRPADDPWTEAWREWADPAPDQVLRGDDEPDILDHHGVWDEIERLKSPRVDLKGGVWMSVEPTRAMVSVDVNTGDDFGKGASLKANLAAAADLPRQLRLRGLGGIVTVDFAPASKRERPQIEAALKRALADDPVQTDLAGWTPLGQLQMQRKRERRPLAELLEGL